MGDQQVDQARRVIGAGGAEHSFRAGVVGAGVEDSGVGGVVDLPSGQRAGGLADVGFGVGAHPQGE